MIEVHLIGYTADLQHLVLDVRPDAHHGRYRLVVDADLFLTVEEIRRLRQGAGSGDGEPTRTAGSSRPGATPRIDRRPREETSADEPAEPAATGPDSDETVNAGREADVASSPDQPVHESKLTPAEIQSLLRAGRSPASVAKAAGTDVTWVERWMVPIVAERDQVLREAHSRRLTRSRLGESGDPLEQAVVRNLAERNIDADDTSWAASRRADGRWTVSVRYRQRGRTRTASWWLDRDAGTLTASSPFARELGWTAPRTRGKASRSSRTSGKASAKPSNGRAASKAGGKGSAPSSRAKGASKAGGKGSATSSRAKGASKAGGKGSAPSSKAKGASKAGAKGSANSSRAKAASKAGAKGEASSRKARGK
ncbi:MAG: DUF3071 domain-containing protein [Actinobacteria bacterium]|nr:DUF3071 domain-containing protein [Actinomycetota bacterium]